DRALCTTCFIATPSGRGQDEKLGDRRARRLLQREDAAGGDILRLEADREAVVIGRPLRIVAAPASLGEAGADDARLYLDDADAAQVVEPQPLAEAVDRVLARDIHGIVGHRGDAGDRADIED